MRLQYEVNLARRWIRSIMICGILLLPNSLAADDDHKGHKGHAHGDHGGRSFLDIGPAGIRFGFQDENFGLQFGPIGPGHRHYYEDHYPVVIPPPIIIEPPMAGPEIYPVPGPIDPMIERWPAGGVAVDRRAFIRTRPEAMAFQRDAEFAFFNDRYGDAARLVNHAIVEDNENGHLHLFAAQTLFAIGDYRGAYAAIHQATRLLPPADWGFVVENFRQFYNDDNYVRQMNRLVEYNRQNPTDSFSRTLCGYHYLSLGYRESGRAELEAALAANAGDVLATQLLTAITPPIPAPPSHEPLPPPAPNSSVPSE
jgi:hypothetical protein